MFLTPMPHLVTLGGANRSIRLSAERLSAQGHEVLVVGSLLGEGPGRLSIRDVELTVAVTKSEGRVQASCQLSGVNYIGLHPLKSSLDVVAASLRNFSPEVVLVAGEDTDGCLHTTAIEFDRSRTAVFAQTPDLLPLNPGDDATLRERWNLLRAASAIIVTSKYAEEVCRAAGLPQASCVIPPAFEVPDEPANAGPYGPIFLGNPSTIKGIDTLISLAIARPARNFTAVRLWATTEEDVVRLAEYSNIAVRSPDQAFTNILRHVSIALVPSIWSENFPLTVVTALGHGIPTITSNVGGLPEAGLGAARVAPPVHPSDTPEKRQAALNLWLDHLDALSDPGTWLQDSERAREAAMTFATTATPERFLDGVVQCLRAAGPTRSGIRSVGASPRDVAQPY